MTPSEQEGYIEAYEHPERYEPELCVHCAKFVLVEVVQRADATVIKCADCGTTIDTI